MSKQDIRAAIALYVICLLASWCWVGHRICPLSFSASIFSLIISAVSFYVMWRMVQYIAKHSGWIKIGFVVYMEPKFMALRYPLYMQAVLDINLVLALLTAAYLDGFNRYFMGMLDLCIFYLIFRKWHTFFKNHQVSSLRSR